MGQREGLRLNQFVLIENLSIQKVIRRRAAAQRLLRVTAQAGFQRVHETSVDRRSGRIRLP
jgi:hypothetical protein